MRIHAVLVALAVLGQPALALDGACPTEATTPKPPVRPRQAVIDRVLAAKPDPGDRVLLVGDSGIFRWKRPLRDETFGVPSFNFGLGGDQTSQVLWRLDRADLSGAAFERIVVSIGSNNFRQRPCEIAAGVSAVVAKLHAMFPSARIAVLSFGPRGRDPEAAKAHSEETTRLIRSAVEAAGHRFVDTYSAVRERCGTSSDCPLYADRLHLGPEGYRVIGRLLKE